MGVAAPIQIHIAAPHNLSFEAQGAALCLLLASIAGESDRSGVGGYLADQSTLRSWMVLMGSADLKT